MSLPKRACDRRKALQLLAGTGAAGLAAPLAACGRRSGAAGRKAIVLGIDGLDPGIVRTLVAQGRLPNFKKLTERGALLPLTTTMPALSPVAWASFITGQTPGGHGIGDFIARDPATHMPVFSIFENRAPRLTIDFGDLHLPLAGGGPTCLRQGKPFWAYLTERGIPAWISRVPTNFPVEETATCALSGLGTPDLFDSYGSFSYYTSDRLEVYGDISGGTVQHVEVRDHRVDAELFGPVNSLVTSEEISSGAGRVSVPLTVRLDPDREAALVEVGGRRLVLEQGEYSDWVKVEFTLLPLIGRVSGIVRFLLKQVRPRFQLYATAVNIDPTDQAVPVTYPKELGAEIARDIGAFWTKGLPADTKALDYRIINDQQYVGQAELLLEEQVALFRHLWARFRDGLFFFYVSSADQDAHMLWRNMDPTHPFHQHSDRRFSGWIHYVYERMDALLGEVLPAVDDSTLLLICSDHGFASFAREFHLNTWLRDHGYLDVRDGARRKEETDITDVDWTRTAAYGIGFNGLYLNLQGRERGGIVKPEQAAALTARLARELEAIVDPETGIRPVAKVYQRDEIYVGEATPGMAELLVGYTPGYRSSSPSVLGGAGRATIGLNRWAWSGDHSMARDLVPGTLAASRPLRTTRPDILDLPVTILDWFGVSRPEQMVGRSLLG
ncbi:MAG: alkaline phosphatase family protein [Deltaproteobacteria bacterium]|nr:alkaline phosphatase family protein [Deltaproteobacteria bacterium]